MNYRHAFHAGNFADCAKHALLLWMLDALQRKPAPFFVLDTHAGVGRYDLIDGDAARTGEWRDGIARLLHEPPPALQRYVEAVSAIGGEGEFIYPGSPLLINQALRKDDRLACCELHPEDAATLRHVFRGEVGRSSPVIAGLDPAIPAVERAAGGTVDPRVKPGGDESRVEPGGDGRLGRRVGVHLRDGYEAIRALLPPKERRGLVLIDPPYEAPGEFERVLKALQDGAARFDHGIYAAWYPIKHRAPVTNFHEAVRLAGLRDVVAAELWLRRPIDPAALNGCGLLVRNAPHGFEAAAGAILGAMSGRLGGTDAGSAVVRITDE